MITKIIYGIDHIYTHEYKGCDWLCNLAEEKPKEFFHCFNATGKKKLGEKRIKILKGLTEQYFIHSPENVRRLTVLRMIKNALK